MPDSLEHIRKRGPGVPREIRPVPSENLGSPLARREILLYNITYTCRCDGIGRRSGLKIHRWRQRTGSSPVTGTSSSQASYRLRRAFSFHCKAHRALILLLLASKPDPLRWAPVRGDRCADGTSFAATFLQKSPLTHSVAAPFQTATTFAGLRFGFSNLHRNLFCQHFPVCRKRHIACDELFHFIAKLTARSFYCSSFPNRTRCAGLRFGATALRTAYRSRRRFFM